MFDQVLAGHISLSASGSAREDGVGALTAAEYTASSLAGYKWSWSTKIIADVVDSADNAPRTTELVTSWADEGFLTLTQIW